MHSLSSVAVLSPFFSSVGLMAWPVLFEWEHYTGMKNSDQFPPRVVARQYVTLTPVVVNRLLWRWALWVEGRLCCSLHSCTTHRDTRAIQRVPIGYDHSLQRVPISQCATTAHYLPVTPRTQQKCFAGLLFTASQTIHSVSSCFFKLSHLEYNYCFKGASSFTFPYPIETDTK